MINRRPILLVAVLVSILAIAFVGVTTARPPPQAICGACGATVVEDATVDGRTPTVTRSELAIQIDRNGTGHWTARTVVQDGRSVAWNRSRLRSNAVTAIESDSTGPENVRDVHVTVDGDTVSVEFLVPDMAHRSAGDVIIVDYFYWDGDSSRWFALDADRVAIHGPSGTAVTSVPDDAIKREGSVVWTRDGDESFDSYPVSQGTVLAFAEDGFGAPFATHVGVGMTVADAKFRDLPGTALLPIVLLGTYALLLVRRGEAIFERNRQQRATLVGGLTAGLAILTILGVFLFGEFGHYDAIGDRFRAAASTLLFPALGVAPVLVPMVGFMGLQYLFGRFVAPGLGKKWYYRSFIWQGLGLVVLGVLSLPFVVASSGRIATVAAGLAAASAVLLFMPLGVAYRQSLRIQYLLGIGIVGAPLLLALGFGPYGGFDRLYFPVFFVPWAIVVGALGVPAFVQGVRFAETGPTHESDDAVQN